MHEVLLIIQLILFLFLSLACFTMPGIFLITKSKIQFSFWEKIILGTVVGFIFFSLLSYLLLVTKLHFLLIPLILLLNLFAIKSTLSLKNQLTFTSKKKLALISLVFFFGVVGQMLIIAPSGSFSNGNLIFWSSHGHDGLWHLSLMEEYKKGYPLQNPVYAGEKLVNYHFFSDIAPADFNHYFKLSTLDLYFRFFPLIFSVLLGGLAYLLGAKLGGSFTAGIWATIFTYFAGSFGYIITYLQNRTISGESLFWASQVQSSIGNPPQIVAFIILLAFLYLFNIFVNRKSKMLFLICALLAGSMAVFKIYGAIILLAGLALVGIWQLIKIREIHILLLFITSGLLSASLYLPNSVNSGSFLIFEPWWFVRTMVVAPDRLNWIDLELKRQTYIFESNWKRVLQIELTAFIIFFFGNLGMRFIGLWGFWKMLRSFFTNYFNQLFVSIIIISFILPMLFLQKGVATNTIQFLQYLLLLVGILAALTVNDIFKRVRFKFLNFLLGLFIVLLSIPTQLALLREFYNRLPFAKIDQQELSALKFLRQNADHKSVVLTPPYNKYLKLNDPIPHIWDWSDTAYVAALSGKRVYLSDSEQVDIMGYDLGKRLSIQERIFMETNPKFFIQEIKNQNINYLYFPKLLKPKVDLNKTPFKFAYSDNLVEIWKLE